MNEINNQLSKSHDKYRLVYDHSRYAYKTNKVMHFGDEKNLYVIVPFPMSTRDNIYELFKVDCIPMAVYDTSTVTELRNVPSYIAVNDESKQYMELSEKQLQTCKESVIGSSWYNCEKFTKIHSTKKIENCAGGILMLDKAVILNTCDPQIKQWNHGDTEILLLNSGDIYLGAVNLNLKRYLICNQGKFIKNIQCKNCLLTIQM